MSYHASKEIGCYSLDNACVESFFGHLKAECHLQDLPPDLSALWDAVADYITFYSTERPRARPGHQAPVEYRLAQTTATLRHV